MTLKYIKSRNIRKWKICFVRVLGTAQRPAAGPRRQPADLKLAPFWPEPRGPPLVGTLPGCYLLRQEAAGVLQKSCQCWRVVGRAHELVQLHGSCQEDQTCLSRRSVTALGTRQLPLEEVFWQEKNPPSFANAKEKKARHEKSRPFHCRIDGSAEKCWHNFHLRARWKAGLRKNLGEFFIFIKPIIR